MESYQAHNGALDAPTLAKILSYSPRTLDRITAPNRSAGSSRVGRKTERASISDQKNRPDSLRTPSLRRTRLVRS